MTITKRSTKGSALTYAEMDENIRDLFEDTTLERVVANGNTATSSASFADIRANQSVVVETGSGATPFTDMDSLYGKRVIWNRSTTQTFRFPLPTASDVGKSVIFMHANQNPSGALLLDFNTNGVGAKVASTDGSGLLTVTNNIIVGEGGVIECIVTAQGQMIIYGSNLINV